MKKTSASYNKNKDTLKTIIFYIILIVIDVFSIRTLYYDLNTYEELNEEIVFLIIILTIIIVGKIIGLCKGWLYKAFNEVRTSKNDKYLRELPNDFGIGVTTLLFDSKIENRKDIVAVILDLCARKYLSLTKSNDKYIIKILKKIDKNLLDNEKYIMELLMNNNIKNIDYYKWYGLCEQDGINLGLYNRYQGEIYDDYNIYEGNMKAGIDEE